MNQIANVASLTLRWIVRDKVIHVVLSLGVLLLVAVPALSLFSLRQVQELSITLCLSSISVVMLLVAALLGSSSIWRDVDRKYTTSLLGLPITRASYVFGKFAGITSVLILICFVMAVLSAIAIAVSSAPYKSDIPIHWVNVSVAILGHGLKAILLAAFALLISSLCTSFFLPFLATFAIFISGNATQAVYEYSLSESGNTMSSALKDVVTGLYYLLPNFSAFDYNVYAIYALPISLHSLLLTCGYFLMYTSILVTLATLIFSRRELP